MEISQFTNAKIVEVEKAVGPTAGQGPNQGSLRRDKLGKRV